MKEKGDQQRSLDNIKERMEKCMKRKGVFIFYILDNEDEVAESTKVNSEVKFQIHSQQVCVNISLLAKSLKSELSKMVLEKVEQDMRHSTVQYWCFPKGYEHQPLTRTTGDWVLLYVIKFEDAA
ncbi:hypothetical protein BTVI_92882 [Pitangus sulphuratus]|nr:hypothetical protein BTVI_92882 [Pitangus sulphuratus]